MGFKRSKREERGWKNTNHTETSVKLLKRTLALHEGGTIPEAEGGKGSAERWRDETGTSSHSDTKLDARRSW